jgi:delta 1-pyrroline-5-carboxylate dehydrogenase
VENPKSALIRAPLKNESVKSEHRRWREWLVSQGSEVFELPERNEFFVGLQKSFDTLDPDSPATFGPGALVVSYQDLKHVVEWIRRSPWSLMTSVFGQPNSTQARELQRLDASLVSMNECVASVGDAALPFGGRAMSGYGVTHGVEGLMQMSRCQSWVEVQRWPGLGWIQPSWKRIQELNNLGGVLKEFDEGPLVAAKRLVSNWRQS